MRSRSVIVGSASAILIIVHTAAFAQTRSAESCASLARQQLPSTKITTAEAISTGSFTPAGSTNVIGNLPPFCRVAGVIAPTPESQIVFEVWLPLDNWNGKFAGVGNGGWAGIISFGPLADQLRRGYATASTNTGHEASPGTNAARFAFDKPEQLIDFAYRAHHETAMQAKALVQAFYSKPAERSYFIGCSSGGYEGLMSAQRFPTDYDGIVAGMPANNWTRLMAGDFDATLAVFTDAASQLTPPALGVLYRGALAACDASDGVTDGVVGDPQRCRFDPSTLVCTTNQAPGSCLSPAQAEAARRVYQGLKDPKTGAQLYPGLAPGSEPFWPNRDPANPFPIPIAHYKWLVFADPNWDWRTFAFTDPADYEAHVKAEAKFAPILNATDPNLRAFQKRGGKADSVPRVGRSADLAAEQHRLLRERALVLWRQQQSRPGGERGPELLPVVHGARHGSLRRRTRPQHVRHAGCAGAMGGARNRARTDHRHAFTQRHRRSHAAPVSVPATCFL